MSPIESMIEINPHIYFDVRDEQAVVQSIYQVIEDHEANPYSLAFLLATIDGHRVPYDIQEALKARETDSDMQSGVNFNQTPLCLDSEQNFLKSADYNYFIVLNESFFYKHYGRRAFIPLTNVKTNNSFFLKGVIYTPCGPLDWSIDRAARDHVSRVWLHSGVWSPTRNIQSFEYKSRLYTSEDLSSILESKKNSPYIFDTWGGVNKRPPIIEY
jgi:hypothetical protein